jgi:hypothetical protein
VIIFKHRYIRLIFNDDQIHADNDDDNDDDDDDDDVVNDGPYA